MKRARFIAAARLEFLAEVGYYADLNADLGRQFRLAVEDAIARAVRFPVAGSPSTLSTRRVLVQRFPFAIHYLVLDDGIVIMAVAPHARRPDYWASRLPTNDDA